MDVHDNNPIVIAPGTGGTGGGDAASSGRQFDPAWTKEKEFLDRTLPARIMCPRCQTIWASGSEYWGHHLFTHWEEDKVTNFLCTVSSQTCSKFSGLARPPLNTKFFPVYRSGVTKRADWIFFLSYFQFFFFFYIFPPVHSS